MLFGIKVKRDVTSVFGSSLRFDGVSGSLHFTQ